MDARRTQRTTKAHKAHRAWILAILALAALVQACTDNNGKSPGPTFPSGTTGFASTGADLTVQVAVNPNTIQPGRRSGVTVLVLNRNGRGVPGKHVQLSTTIGELDVVDGFTDADGKFVSWLKISEQAASVATSGTVTAFVEGKTGSATVTSGENVALVVLPTFLVIPDVTNVGGSCTVSRTFEIVGGVPPFQIAAISGTSSVSGRSVTMTTTVPAGTSIVLAFQVADSLGNTAIGQAGGDCI